MVTRSYRREPAGTEKLVKEKIKGLQEELTRNKAVGGAQHAHVVEQLECRSRQKHPMLKSERLLILAAQQLRKRQPWCISGSQANPCVIPHV